MGFRLQRRLSLGRGWWLALSKSGPSLGRGGRRSGLTLSRRGVGRSARLMRGLSYLLRRR